MLYSMKRCAVDRYLLIVAGIVWVGMVAAANAVNPYLAIVERNSFGLKPPVNPADLVKPPSPVVAEIKLQGMTTILGRKQVLLKVRVPAKPPETARDESLVIVEGQREGEVEVLEINQDEGTVRLKNGGTPLVLNMKDHAEKPVPSPSPAAAPGAPQVGNIKSPTPQPLPGSPAVPNPAGASVSTFGGGVGPGVAGFGGAATSGNSAAKSIPTRTLRSNSTLGANNPHPAGEFQNLSPEAQAILIEAQRAQIAPGGFDPLPKTPLAPRQ